MTPELLASAAHAYQELRQHKGTAQFIINADPYLLTAEKYDKAATVIVDSQAHITAGDLDALKAAFEAPAAARWHVNRIPWLDNSIQASLTWMLP